MSFLINLLKNSKIISFYLLIMKELLILCLIIIIILLLINLQRILTENFSGLNNPHNCPPFSVTHNPFNSHLTHVKGWCTERNYDSLKNPDDFDSFEKSPIKCPSDYSRVSAKESSSFKSKAYCKKPTVY